MTDPTSKTRTPRNTKPLGAGEAFDLIMSRLDTRDDQIARFAAEFDRRQAELERHTFERVPVSQHDRLGRMLRDEIQLRASAEAPAPQPPEASEEIPEEITSRPEWLDKEPKATTKPIAIDRERKTGAPR
jgi:hypothetical protein